MRILMAILLGLFNFSVHAIDVTLNINGGILPESCNIVSQDLTKNVDFPDLDPRDFKYFGANSAEQMVAIRLEKCTGQINNMTYQFSGEAEMTDPSLLKVMGKNGASQDTLATGLAIEILDRNKNKIALNTKQALNEVFTNTNYTLNFYFRYKSISNTVSPGDASSIAYLDIYYE